MPASMCEDIPDYGDLEIEMEPYERLEQAIPEITARLCQLAGFDSDVSALEPETREKLDAALAQIEDAALTLIAVLDYMRIDKAIRRPSEEWRDQLRRMRDGRLDLADAVTDGRVPIALRHGARRAGLWDSLAPNWLHGLRDDRRALRLAVEAALADKMLEDPRGRPDNFHLHSFIARVSAASQIFTGKPLARSVTSETGSGGRSGGKPSGPGIAFVRVCLVSVIGAISDEAIAHGIRRAAKDPRLLR